MNGCSDVVNRHWSCTFGGFCVYMKCVWIRYYIGLINWKKLCRIMKLKCFFFSLTYMIYCFILIELKWLFSPIFMIYCSIILNLKKLWIHDKHTSKRIIKAEYLFFFKLFHFLNNIIFIFMHLNWMNCI